MLWFIEARRINSKRWALEAIFKEGKGVLGFSKASPTLFVNENKMSYVQDSFSLQDGRIAYLHRPTQGWTVREYILTWQSKLASSTVQPWVGRLWTTSFLIWRYTGSVERAYISLFINCFPCTASKLSSAKGHGKASLNWLLPSQGPSTSRDEEMLEAMVDESGCLTQICDVKRQLICSNSCRQRYCQANRGNKTRSGWSHSGWIWREIL